MFRRSVTLKKTKVCLLIQASEYYGEVVHSYNQDILKQILIEAQIKVKYLNGE